MTVEIAIIIDQVKISQKREMKFIPSIGDELFFELQRTVVYKRWWYITNDTVFISCAITNFYGNDVVLDKEYWKVLLETFPWDKWHWSGTFPQYLREVIHESRTNAS